MCIYYIHRVTLDAFLKLNIPLKLLYQNLENI